MFYAPLQEHLPHYLHNSFFEDEFAQNQIFYKDSERVCFESEPLRLLAYLSYTPVLKNYRAVEKHNLFFYDLDLSQY